MTKSIEIAAPVQTVWSFIEDPSEELKWRGPTITELEQVDEGPLAPGVRFRGKAKTGPGKPEPYVNEVTCVAPPRAITWRNLEGEGDVSGEGAYRLDPSKTGTRMEIDIVYESTGVGGVLRLPMIRIVSPIFLGRFLERLKHLAEARAGGRELPDPGV